MVLNIDGTPLAHHGMSVNNLAALPATQHHGWWVAFSYSPTVIVQEEQCMQGFPRPELTPGVHMLVWVIHAHLPLYSRDGVSYVTDHSLHGMHTGSYFVTILTTGFNCSIVTHRG